MYCIQIPACVVVFGLLWCYYMSKRIAIVAAVAFGILVLGVFVIENVNADDEASQYYKIDNLRVSERINK